MNITNLSLQGLNLKLSDDDYDSLFNEGVSVVINGKIFKMEGAVSCSGKMSSNNPYIPDEEYYTMDVASVLEDTKVPQQSIFDNPRWVTFDASKDLMGCFLDTLVDGQDYKVTQVKTLTEGDKNYLLENGVRAHESYFHKVTPQDLLPEEVEESFDNLVYVEPKSSDTSQYFSLKRSSCSEEQWNYVIKCLGNPLDCLGNDKTLQWCCDDKIWFDDVGYPNDTVVFFNDIFQEVN